MTSDVLTAAAAAEWW